MNSVGVNPVYSLNVLKKVEREEKPDIAATLSIEYSCVIPCSSSDLACSTRLEARSVVKLVSIKSLKQYEMWCCGTFNAFASSVRLNAGLR